VALDEPSNALAGHRLERLDGRKLHPELLGLLHDGGAERVLRACITSYRTEEEDLNCLIKELEAVRETLAACTE
jgi:hypothetical protein